MISTLISLVSKIAPSVGQLLGGPVGGAVLSLISNKLFGKSDASIADIIKLLINKPEDSDVKLKELEAELQVRMAEIDYKKMKLDYEADTEQVRVNKEVAQYGFFHAGWRSAIGWVGVYGLINHYLLVPYATALGYSIIDPDVTVLIGLLTILVGARTYDKIKGAIS